MFGLIGEVYEYIMDIRLLDACHKRGYSVCTEWNAPAAGYTTHAVKDSGGRLMGILTYSTQTGRLELSSGTPEVQTVAVRLGAVKI